MEKTINKDHIRSKERTHKINIKTLSEILQEKTMSKIIALSKEERIRIAKNIWQIK